jgi:N-hydroxyarylamine O-acetyltransferase
VPFDHLTLRVATSEGPLLADVGFGASFGEPLRFDAPGPQQDPNGTYELVPRTDGWIDLLQNGSPQFRFDPTPRGCLESFRPGLAHHTTSPASHFTQRTVCSLPVDGGRVTISNRTLTTTLHGERTERDLDDDELRHAYRTTFGMELDRLPTIPA